MKHSASSNDGDYITIKKYLTTENLCPDSTAIGIWDKLATLVNDSLVAINYTPVKLGCAIVNIFRQLINPQYSSAESALYRLLNRIDKKCFVLIDSIEVYDIHDSISSAIATALIESVRQFNSDSKKRIIVKAAFPSEIYPFLRPLNKEKMEGKNLFILWRYKDLFCLLAKRYFNKFGDQSNNFKFLEMDNYDKAREYLFNYFPETVTADQGITFNSVAYIIRHTQKKPRQTILIFNIIHTLAEENELDLQKLPSEFINKGVHARLDILVDGALDIYEHIYKDATRIVKRILHGMPVCFDYSELTKKLKEVNTLRQQGNLSCEDVIRLLLECSAIGVQMNPGQSLGNNIELVEGYFEYQVKGTIEATNNTTFVIHPMFYQESCNVIDMKKYIYPVPLEDEEKELINKMKIKIS